MKAQSGMTFVAPIKAELNGDAIEERRNDIRTIRPEPGELLDCIHFFSACIISLAPPEENNQGKYFAVMEVSFDGSEHDMINQLCQRGALADKVDTIFKDCENYPTLPMAADRKDFLKQHQKEQALFFVGSKDLPVQKIHAQNR